MADCREVDADLMGPPGLELNRDERSGSIHLPRLDVRDGALAALAHAERDRPDPPERRVDGLALGQLAFAEREVVLADPLRLELSGEL
jgi:hypothetical protein